MFGNGIILEAFSLFLFLGVSSGLGQGYSPIGPSFPSWNIYGNGFQPNAGSTGEKDPAQRPVLNLQNPSAVGQQHNTPLMQGGVPIPNPWNIFEQNQAMLVGLMNGFQNGHLPLTGVYGQGNRPFPQNPGMIGQAFPDSGTTQAGNQHFPNPSNSQLPNVQNPSRPLPSGMNQGSQFPGSSLQNPAENPQINNNPQPIGSDQFPGNMGQIQNPGGAANPVVDPNAHAEQNPNQLPGMNPNPVVEQNPGPNPVAEQTPGLNPVAEQEPGSNPVVDQNPGPTTVAEPNPGPNPVIPQNPDLNPTGQATSSPSDPAQNSVNGGNYDDYDDLVEMLSNGGTGNH